MHILLKSPFFLAAALAASLGSPAWAQSPAASPANNSAAVRAEGGWARATVQGQKASGAFVKLTSKVGLQLVGASSPVAGVTEVHEMKMDGDVMKMRAIPSLELPAGTAVELKPGGYHIMLMDLKAPLAKGSTVPLTLSFKDAKGSPSTLELKLPVDTKAPGASGTEASGMHKH